MLTLYGRLYPDPHPKRVSLQDRRCDLFLLRLDWATAAETCQQAITEGLVVGAPSRKAVMGSYEKLAQAERERGHKAAADRAQAEAKKLALILEEEAKKAQNKDSGKEAAPSQ